MALTRHSLGFLQLLRCHLANEEDESSSNYAAFAHVCSTNICCSSFIIRQCLIHEESSWFGLLDGNI